MSETIIERVTKVFKKLKQESYKEGRNLATRNNLAKESKTSRSNFYEQASKSNEWSKLVADIDEFAKEFSDYANRKNKPTEEKKETNQLNNVVKMTMEQNLELLEQINDLSDENKQKNLIIKSLEDRIRTQMMINYNGGKMNNDYYLRVYYEDTDAGGVVYHSIYLNFVERARSEIFFQNGISPMDNEFHFVVKEINAKFLKSAKLGDELKIKTNVMKIKNASVKLYQIIYFKENPKIKVFEAMVDIVCLKGDKISKIPLKFQNILNQNYDKY